MFTWNESSAALAALVTDWSRTRIAERGQSPAQPPEQADLTALLAPMLTPGGIGSEAAFAAFTDIIAPACQPVDHERFLAFVAHSPAISASLFDMALSASAIFGTSWLEAAGATTAENLALRWLADCAGMPESAGGTFLSGATVANLNALAAARLAWRHIHPANTGRLAVAMTAEAHASARMVARCLDFEIIDVPVNERGLLTGPNLQSSLLNVTVPVCAVVATGGITNMGLVDDLASVAEVCEQHGLWFHIDAAYGGAALLLPEKRHLFTGIEQADSLVIDPHKWLFTPLDCSALIFRQPALAKAAFTQHADYLAAFQEVGEWNPGDFAMHLTRRARGLPFWFMLAAHGSDAVVSAVRASTDLATATAREIEQRPNLTLLLEPELSVVLFTVGDWTAADYRQFCDRLLAEGTAFILPTQFDGDSALRFCFVNPRTTIEDVRAILDQIGQQSRIPPSAGSVQGK